MFPVRSCSIPSSAALELSGYAGPGAGESSSVGSRTYFAIDVRDADGHLPFEAALYLYDPYASYLMTLSLDCGADTRLAYVASLTFGGAGRVGGPRGP